MTFRHIPYFSTCKSYVLALLVHVEGVAQVVEGLRRSLVVGEDGVAVLRAAEGGALLLAQGGRALRTHLRAGDLLGGGGVHADAGRIKEGNRFVCEKHSMCMFSLWSAAAVLKGTQSYLLQENDFSDLQSTCMGSCEWDVGVLALSTTKIIG